MSWSYRSSCVASSGRVAAVARAGVFAGVALAATAKSSAGNWEYQPRVELGGVYNDNYRMAEQGQAKTSIYGAILDAAFAMRDVNPRSDIAFVPRVHSSYFPNDATDQSTDGFLDVLGHYRTPKSASGFILQLADESVFSSEILSASIPGVSLGQTVNGESGRVNVRNRRKLGRLAPTLTYDWDQRKKLHFDLDYTKASYDHSRVEQAGFSNLYGAVGLEYVITPRSSFTVRGLAARFDPQGSSNNNTNRYGVEAEWDLQRTQVMQTYVRLGVNRTDAQNGAVSVTNTGVTGGAGIRWNYQITQLTLDALRSLVPSSAGAVVTSNELRFRIKRALRPRLWGFVAVRGVQVRGAVQEVAFVQERDFAAGTAGFEWRMTRNYRITGAYDYTWQRFQGEPTAASSGATLSVVYQPQSKYEPINNSLLPAD